MSAEDDMETIIRKVSELGRIQAKLGPDDDFYDAGLSSLVVLQLIMDLEDAFSVSFEGRDDEFIKARTARSLYGLIQSLG